MWEIFARLSRALSLQIILVANESLYNGFNNNTGEDEKIRCDEPVYLR